jgi:hypothetical protein
MPKNRPSKKKRDLWTGKVAPRNEQERQYLRDKPNPSHEENWATPEPEETTALTGVQGRDSPNERIVGQLSQTEFDRREAEGSQHDRPEAPKRNAAVPPSSAFANFPPDLESRPLLPGIAGSYPADTMTWSYINRSWATAWSGNLLRGKHTSGTLPPPLDLRPEPHAQSGEAVSVTWSYGTRRWKITWADDFSMKSARFLESTQVVYSCSTHC